MPVKFMSKSISAGSNLYNQKDDDHCRVALMGPAGVGKSSIIHQFLYDNFLSDYKETVEELHREKFEVDGVKLTLDILDTAGAYTFPAMRKLAIATCNAFILVYSVEDKESFEEVAKLRNLIIEERGTDEVPVVIVGNKADAVSNQRAVVKETAEAIACLDWNSGYVEASAKDNVNIVTIFKEILRLSKVEYDLSPALRRRKQSLTLFQSKNQSPKDRPRNRGSILRSLFTTQRSSP